LLLPCLAQPIAAAALPCLELILVQLKALSLANNEISAVENVQQLTTLEKLNLSRNRLESLAGLSVLLSLIELDVSFNRVETVHSRDLPPRLKILNVSSNCIQQQSQLASLSQSTCLTSLRIAGSHLSIRVFFLFALTFSAYVFMSYGFFRQPLLYHGRLYPRPCCFAASSCFD
jgi:Leucine-rich repeat (LRR) protein